MADLEDLQGTNTLREAWPKIEHNDQALNAELAQHDQRITNIVASAGDSNTEIVDARQPASGDAFAVLKDRLDAGDVTVAEHLADVAKEVGPVYNVIGYGAKGTGTDDDTTVIQAVIDLVVDAGGGTVYFPSGSYKITSELTWSAPLVRIEFEPGSVLLPYGCNGFRYGDATGAQRHNYNSFVNIKIDMTNAATYTAIIAENADENRFDRVRITKGAIGIDLDYSYNNTLIDCVVISQSNIALRVDIGDKTTIIRGQFGNGNKGMVFTGGKGITIIGASIERHNDVAIYFGSSNTRGGEYADGINLIGNYLERNCMVSGVAFIQLGEYNDAVGDYCKGINLIGNYFNWDTGNPRSPVVPFIHLDRVANCTIQANRYTNSTTYLTFDLTHSDFRKSITAINDTSLKDLGRGPVRGSANNYLLPFSVSVATNGSGEGTYNYDVSAFAFNSVYAAGNLNSGNSASSFVDFTLGTTTVVLKVHGASASTNVTVVGFIVGVWT